MKELKLHLYISDTVFATPNDVRYCTVYTQTTLEFTRTHGYYVAHPNDWPIESSKIIKATIAHEFGHAVGMMHHFGVDSTRIMAERKMNHSFRWKVGLPYFTEEYADTSRKEFTIKRVAQ